MLNGEKNWNDLSLTRRIFINTAFLFTAVVAMAGSIYPLVRYLFPDTSRKAGKKESFRISVSEVLVGEARFFKFKRKAAVIIRKNDKEIIAMSAVCTHLGCVVKYSEKDAMLVCPCHGGKFDLNGKVKGGPPPRPLQMYSASIDGDKIVVEEA